MAKKVMIAWDSVDLSTIRLWALRASVAPPSFDYVANQNRTDAAALEEPDDTATPLQLWLMLISGLFGLMLVGPGWPENTGLKWVTREIGPPIFSWHKYDLSQMHDQKPLCCLENRDEYSENEWYECCRPWSSFSGAMSFEKTVWGCSRSAHKAE